MHSNVAEHVYRKLCLSCQRRKTSHRPPTLPTRHRPVTKPFQVVAVDLVEHKSKSKGNCLVLSIIGHPTRHLITIPIKSVMLDTTPRHAKLRSRSQESLIVSDGSSRGLVPPSCLISDSVPPKLNQAALCVTSGWCGLLEPLNSCLLPSTPPRFFSPVA